MVIEFVTAEEAELWKSAALAYTQSFSGNARSGFAHPSSFSPDYADGVVLAFRARKQLPTLPNGSNEFAVYNAEGHITGVAVLNSDGVKIA